MPYIAPPLIAGLSHVTLLLYTILCSILSFWTRHRVRLATSASPFDYTSPLTEKRVSIVEKRHKSLSFRASRFPLSRRSSSVSVSSASDLAAMSPPPISPISIGRSRRKPPPPLNFHGITTNYYSPSSPSIIDDDVSSVAGSLFDGIGEGDSGYWLEEEDSNSPTGSLLDEKAGGWLPSAADLSPADTNARRILCLLAVLRAALVAPAVYQEFVTKTFDWPTILLLNLDLLMVDFVLALVVAAAPILTCLFTLSTTLPHSFSHHHYHFSLISTVLPLFATIQVPLPEYYRLGCPVISVVIFLISRDEAITKYWQPLIAKRNSQTWL